MDPKHIPSKIIECARVGPLTPYIDSYVRLLNEEGYATRKHPVPQEFGVVDFGADAVHPEEALYRPHLGQSGPFHRVKRIAFNAALGTLVSLGWLDPGQRLCKSTRYRLSDAAQVDYLFRYQVQIL